MRLCFAIGVYQDEDLATRLINDLRRHYPADEGADIFVRCDGDCTREFGMFCRSQHAEYGSGERLKLAQFGGEWLANLLVGFTVFSSAETVIKLDPDSRIHRRFARFPDADLAADIREYSGGQYLQGGCIAMKRSAAEALLASPILDDPLYRTEAFSYQRYRSPHRQPWELDSSERLSASDLILSHASQRLGLSWAQWTEVLSFPLKEELEAALTGLPDDEIAQRYAVTHPWKI